MARPVKEKEVILIGGQLTQGFLLGISPYMVSLVLTIILQRRSHFPCFEEKAIANESYVSCLRAHHWEKGGRQTPDS